MKVVGIDLGGTKIAAGVVNKQGKIFESLILSTNVKGEWPGLRKQILDLVQYFSQKHQIRAVGIGSAGPLDSDKGLLLDPTNFHWKRRVPVKLVAELQKSLNMPVFLENDAAASILAENWKGKAKPNSIILTLGTGLGIGVFSNGALVRGGRNLHPEGGHLIIHPNDKKNKCGCGNFGCAEAYLSGKNFERIASREFKKNINGKEIVLLAKKKNKKALRLLNEYAHNLALYLHSLVVLYYPEEIIFAGSFAAVFPYIEKTTKKDLFQLIERRLDTIPLMPKLRRSNLGNEAAFLGGACLAFRNRKKL
ncbi:MAG: ROK family protein [Oligoflexia bacterium]|nr:ROK family protein [Oligoflexia bacterium]